MLGVYQSKLLAAKNIIKLEVLVITGVGAISVARNEDHYRADIPFQVIFQTVIDQVHLLHEKEEWHQEITDEHGAITELPDMFGAIVTESVQVSF